MSMRIITEMLSTGNVSVSPVILGKCFGQHGFCNWCFLFW